MKNKNYEKTTLIKIIIIIFALLIIIFLTFTINHKIFTYKTINGIVIKKNTLLIVISKKQQEIIDKNTYMYLNNKKTKYNILEVRKDSIKKGKDKYNEIIINCKFDKSYKTNDVINLQLKDKKIRIIEMFKLIWEGD